MTHNLQFSYGRFPKQRYPLANHIMPLLISETTTDLLVNKELRI